MKGFIYRLGVSLKEFGERSKLDDLIRFGLSIRKWACSL